MSAVTTVVRAPVRAPAVARGRSLPRALARDWVALAACVVIVAALASALGASFLAPVDPLKQDLSQRLHAPVPFPGSDAAWPLGTDPFGRDILSRLIYGARISMFVGITAVLLQGAIGLAAGLAAGYYGGRLDSLIMRIVDIQLGIPFLVLAIAVAAVLGNSLTNIVITLTVTGWVAYARLIRGSCLALREAQFVEVARASGATGWRIMRRHLLPNLVGMWLVVATFQVTRMIIAEASLSYLGLGIDPQTPSWGGMAADGRDYLSSAWWVATLPGLIIAAVGLSFNLLGDWLRDHLDPAGRFEQ